jgi:hypothetical protein
MLIDAQQLRAVVQLVFGTDHPALTRAEAEAIIGIAYLALEADLDEDSDELADFELLKQRISALAVVAPVAVAPISPIPLDDEERASHLRELANQLPRKLSRELAFAVAYLLVVADLALQPVESTFLDQLQRALGIDDTAASVLAESAAEAVTPPPPDEPRMEL